MEVIEKKEIIHEDNHDSNKYASKAVGGTALGLSIGALVWSALNSGGNGLFGWGSRSNQVCNEQYLERKECQDYIDITKEYLNGRLEDQKALAELFYSADKKINESTFGLYKSQRDGFDVLADRISKLEIKAAVDEAVEPWRDKVLQMQIGNVVGMVNLECQKRSCADNTLVNYMNSTFYPKYMANVTVGTATTEQDTYNPLRNNCCDCNNTIIL